jgi:hypothetical protein
MSPHDDAQTSAFSDHSAALLRLIKAAGVDYGREDSFKISRGTLRTQRLLLGVPTHNLTAAGVLAWCDHLNMPLRLREIFATHLAEANMVGLGVEYAGERVAYKMYLEFWEKVRQTLLRFRRTDPLLLHLGFKWNAGDEDDPGRAAHYTCFPILSVDASLARIARIYEHATPPTGLSCITDIVRQASAAAPGTLFIYVEAEEEGESSPAFDINLYKSDLRLADVATSILDLARFHGIPDADIKSLLAQVGEHRLGHLSGGIDRRGHESTTFYYETRLLDD